MIAEIRLNRRRDVVNHTEQSDEVFPVSCGTAQYSANLIETAANCNTQYRSASCCSNVIT